MSNAAATHVFVLPVLLLCSLLHHVKLSSAWTVPTVSTRGRASRQSRCHRDDHVSPELRAAPSTRLCITDSTTEYTIDDKIMTRRSIFEGALLVAATALVAVPTRAYAAVAKESNNDQQEQSGVVSPTVVADRLRQVPTFCIVDKTGIPYMVVGEDAKVTGYFFTTYAEANRLLSLARTSADTNIQEALRDLRRLRRQQKLPPLSKVEEEDQVGSNPWTTARISTVPLDVAVTFVTKSSMSSRRAGGGNYFQVAPAESDVQDALALDKSGKDELAEGKVPLFYFSDFEITTSNGEKQSPLYFRKSELVQEWKRRNSSSSELPDILVTELFQVLREMVKPGGTDKDLQTIVFRAPKESAQKAKECLEKHEVQFLVGQRIIVL